MTGITTDGQRGKRIYRTSRERSLDYTSRGSKTMVTVVLVIAAFYFLIPIWWLLVSSTKSVGTLTTTNGFWFGQFDLFSNVGRVFTYDGAQFGLWMANSLVYAGVGGAIATFVGAACGYALSKYAFRGRGILFGFIMSGVLLPQALLTVPLFLLFSQLHLTNTYWSVLIPACVSPFAVYLSRVYAATSVPDELIEAARVDGASEVRIFLTISLRIMSPAVVTVFLFTFVSIWNNFFLPLIMLTDSGLDPVTLGLYGWFQRTQESDSGIVGLVIAGSLISVLPLVIAFLSLQRFWQSGLTAGSVKS